MKLKQVFLVLTCLIISFQITAQDIIYKKNGEKTDVIVLKKSGQSRSYKLYNQPDTFTWYISTAILDSIVYQNGEKENFKTNNANLNLPVQGPHFRYKHHLVGTDIMGLLYGNASMSYEYLPGKCTVGFKSILAFKLNPVSMEEWEVTNYYNSQNFNNGMTWHAQLGLNYYFFPPRTFRFSTGFYYIFGTYTLTKFMESGDSSVIVIKENKWLHGALISLFGFYNITKSLAINLGIYFPLYMNPSFNRSVLSSEILINF